MRNNGIAGVGICLNALISNSPCAEPRSILCSRPGCGNERLAFGASEHGKPFALLDEIAAPVSSNFSHSGKRGLVALAPDGRFGVDVEERVDRLDFDRMSEIVFGLDGQADFASVRGGEKFRSFFTLWTFKEALTRNLGTGFSLDPYRLRLCELYVAAQEKASSVFPGCQASNGDPKT